MREQRESKDNEIKTFKMATDEIDEIMREVFGGD